MESLQELARQVDRQRQLTALECSLNKQIAEVQRKADELKAQWNAEQADVEKLTQMSLTAIVYGLLGKKEDKLEKEQREALAAAARYQNAQAELDGLWRERETIRSEQLSLQDCKQRFEAAKQLRAEELKSADPMLGQQILEVETQLGTIEGQKQELQEAMDAGNDALFTVRDVQKELDEAENWGTWDMLGGGLITQMAKHEHLDSAQALIHRLQNQLRQFKTELADVEIHAELYIQIDEFLRFADWFFDGIIVDWTVQERIEQAKEDVYQTAWQIQCFLNRLDQLNTDLLRREDQAKEELEQLLLSAEA